MSSLIEELQNEVVNQEKKMSSILGKALLLSHKLKVDNINLWLKNEMNGYFEVKSKLPNYRILYGELKRYNKFYNRWDRVDMLKIPSQLRINKIGMPNSVGMIESELEIIKGDTIYLTYPDEMNDVLCKLLNTTQAGLLIYKSQYYKILDALRNTLLNWTIELEKKGIASDKSSFSDEDVKKAQTIIINVFQGNVNDSQINNSSSNSNQDIN